jgi:hypothetical protein
LLLCCTVVAVVVPCLLVGLVAWLLGAQRNLNFEFLILAPKLFITKNLSRKLERKIPKV